MSILNLACQKQNFFFFPLYSLKCTSLRPKITQYLACRSGSDILVSGGPVKTQTARLSNSEFLIQWAWGRDYECEFLSSQVILTFWQPHLENHWHTAIN